MLNNPTRFEESIPGLLVMNGAYFGDIPTVRIAPPRLSLADSGSYRATKVGSMLQALATKRGGRDPYRSINGATENKTFTVTDRGLEFGIDPKDIRDLGGDENQAVLAAALPALYTVMLGLHNDLVTLLTSTGITQTEAAGAAWDNSSSDPIQDVHDAIISGYKGSPVLPNVMVIGREKAYALTRHAKIKGLFGGGDTTFMAPAVVEAKLAQAFGLEEVIIDATRRNTADEGQTASYSYLFPNNQAVLLRRERTPTPNVPQTVRTFVNPQSLTDAFEAMSIPGMEVLADAVQAWTWGVGNPGGRKGIVAVLAEPNIVNAETGVRITSI